MFVQGRNSANHYYGAQYLHNMYCITALSTRHFILK